MPKDTQKLVQKAVEARLRNKGLESSDAFRLIHSTGDDLPGITADKLGSVLLVERHYREVDIDPVVDALASIFGDEPPIFVKERWSKDLSLLCGKQVRGTETGGKVTVSENGLTFQLDVCSGEHIGLFLDGRLVRQRVGESAPGKRVLNLFAYSCAFGVAAAAGGARSTTNVDNKKSALAAGRKNYTLNGLSADTRTFLRDDATKYLARTVRGRGKYDLVILDPPPRFRAARNRFVTALDVYDRLARKCVSVLDRQGILLAGLNTKGEKDDGFEKLVLDAARTSGRDARVLERLGPGADFPKSDDRPTARFITLEIA